MPQSLARVYVHLVFSTKNRVAVIAEAHRVRLHAYMGGILRDLGAPPLEIHAEPDHTHILFVLSRTVTLSDTVRDLKRASSLWLKGVDGAYRDFHWQNGYGAFSVSGSKLETVAAYVRNQPEHHRTESFQDEFRRWLRAYGLEWDERYVWD